MLSCTMWLFLLYSFLKLVICFCHLKNIFQVVAESFFSPLCDEWRKIVPLYWALSRWGLLMCILTVFGLYSGTFPVLTQLNPVKTNYAVWIWDAAFVWHANSKLTKLKQWRTERFITFQSVQSLPSLEALPPPGTLLQSLFEHSAQTWSKWVFEVSFILLITLQTRAYNKLWTLRGELKWINKPNEIKKDDYSQFYALSIQCSWSRGQGDR